MKKYYKIATLALAGVLVAQTATPALAFSDQEASTQVEAETVYTQQSISETETGNTSTDETKTEDSEVENPETENSGVENSTTETLKNDETNNEGTYDNHADDNGTEASNSEASNSEASNSEASNPETEATDELEGKTLEELENDEKFELIDPVAGEDFNNDGIDDVYTKMLCDGEILTADGQKVFGDYTYAQLQECDDFDGDGLKNGEEIRIEIGEDGKPYAVILSDPFKVDTDEDGVYDKEDTDNTVNKVTENDVVGNVRLVARHDEKKGPMHGHVYIVFTSYVDGLEISIDNLYDYYLANPDIQKELVATCDSDDEAAVSIVSWRSTVDEINEANDAARAEAADKMYIQHKTEKGKRTSAKIILNRGEYISIGNYGMAEKATVVNEDYLKFLEKEEHLSEEELAKVTTLVQRIFGDEGITKEYVMSNYKELLPIIAEHGIALANHACDTYTDGGVWINRELYNQKYAYDQGPNQVVEHDATAKDLNVMLNYFQEHSRFNTFTYNCTTVGAGAWNATFGTKQDENGINVDTEYKVVSDVNIDYSVKNPYKGNQEETFKQNISLPLLVKLSIASMKNNVEGYIGNMTYVTGKKISALVNKFDITKLFRKKAKANQETNETPVAPSTPASSQKDASASRTYNRLNVSASVNNSTPALIDETITALSSVAGTEDLVEEKTIAGNTKITKVASADDVTEETVSDEEAVAEEESTEEVSQPETLTVDDEEVPLGIEAASKTLLYVWLGFVGFLVVAGAVTTGLILHKKRS